MGVATIRAMDLPQYVPYQLDRTSEGLGWRGFRAETVRGHAPGELTLPPLDHHLLNLIVAVPNEHEHRWDGRARSERGRPGAASLVPAGADSYWRWRYLEPGVACDFHLHLQPAFVRRVAAAGMEELPVGEAELASELCFAEPEVKTLGLALMEAVEGEGRHGALYAESLATALVSVLLSLQRPRRGMPVGRPTRAAQLHRVLEYIEDHLAEELHLEDLAALVEMGPDRFARGFREAMGVSPYRYVVGRRVERARQMLRATRMPLAQVALATGFADHAHFANSFRRFVGQTPGAFRREAQR